MASSSRILSLTDPSAFATIYPSADVEVLSAAKGKFLAELTQVRINQLWVHGIHISQPVINTVAVDPRRRSFGFLTESNSSSLVNCSTEVHPGDLVLNSSAVVHQRSGANFHYGALSLPFDNLAAAAEAVAGTELPVNFDQSAIRLPRTLMGRLHQLHRSVVHLAEDRPDILQSTEVSRVLEAELTHILVRCLGEGRPSKTKGGRQLARAFNRFVEFLEANPNRPLHLVEICEAIGVAERTLRSACEEFIGLGPIRYLSLRRMHQARRALQASDPSTTSVTRIATDYGFWELGRFSVTYHALFGETPSETLRQTPRLMQATTNGLFSF